MNKPPAFQFYADDFLSGTSEMTNEEVGSYIRLLCHQWNKGGLPNDPERLARMAGYSGANGGAIATPSFGYVMAKFSVCDDGMLRNARMERVRAESQQYREKQAENGKKGALNRWNHGGAIATPLATPLANASPNDSSPSPSPSPNDIHKRKGTVDEIKAYCVSKGLPESDGQWFYDKCVGNGWTNDGKPIASWRGTISSWAGQGYMASQKQKQPQLFNQPKPEPRRFIPDAK